MNVFKEAYKWFDKAEADLLVATQVLHDFNIKTIDISCFLSQQAVEKSLKGYLVCQGINPPRTHDLIRLREMCAEFDASFNNLLNSDIDLSTYAVDTRYPGEEVATESEAASALAEAKNVYIFCTSQVQALQALSTK
ncbi:MAG: HEPN domain-containing protein [Deltaproteobacteria bacterium]|jgi:HEPN domain-containing protein|nr:HEPN domain-containing protein [Deltaproteobacteria bacterium]